MLFDWDSEVDNRNLDLAPVAIFAYERLDHLKKTVNALVLNDLAADTNVFIFSDGAKLHNQNKISEVRSYLKTIKGFSSVNIIEREKNYGLSENIINGVNFILEKYEKIIVLEDDLVTSKNFLKFMNDALKFYAAHDNVSCISGYIYPIKGLKSDFFIKGADCWGWGTWKKNWRYFVEDGRDLLLKLTERKLFSTPFDKAWNYDRMLLDQISGKNSSWAIRWYYSSVLNDQLCFYPRKTLVRNIGNDGSGTHSIDTDMFNSDLQDEYIFNPVSVQECVNSKMLLKKYALKQKSLITRLPRRLNSILKMAVQ